MSRCTVCSHLKRNEIDRHLVDPAHNLSALARQFGFSRDALRRHRERHLGEMLVDLGRRAASLDGEQLHAQAQDLYLRALSALSLAEAGIVVRVDDDGVEHRRVSVGALGTALREARACVETLAKLAVMAPTGGEVEAGTAKPELDVAIAAALSAALSRRQLQRGLASGGADSVIEDADVVGHADTTS